MKLENKQLPQSMERKFYTIKQTDKFIMLISLLNNHKSAIINEVEFHETMGGNLKFSYKEYQMRANDQMGDLWLFCEKFCPEQVLAELAEYLDNEL